MIVKPTAPMPPPPAWSCLVQAWSHVIQWPYWSIVKAIGHDGSEIIWPDQPEPYNHRGFHPQELIYLGDRFGFVTTTFEPQPNSISGTKPYVIILHDEFKKIIASSDGVVTGLRRDNARHAIAWVSGEVIDCNQGSTRVENLDDFQIQAFHRIKSKWWFSRFENE